MAPLNHLAISAALGSTIGPKVAVPHGQIASPQLASTIDNLLHRRRYLWSDESDLAHGISNRYMKSIKAAFLRVRDGLSPDRVIADPVLNARFIDACRQDFGIEDSVCRMNLALLFLRKTGQLPRLHSKRGPSVNNPYEIIHGCEMAARAMYYQYGVSVDGLMCDPEMVKEFGRIAKSIVPGRSAFDYRWVALNARKKGTEAAKKINKEVPLYWSREINFSAIGSLPDEEGLLSLHENDNCLLLLASDDLSDSVENSQRILDAEIVSPELWSPIAGCLHWRYANLPDTTATERYGYLHNLVGRVKPVFNIPRGRKAA